MNAIMTANGTLASRVPFEDYLKIDAVSISVLKELKRSPQHYQWRRANPLSSAPLTLGRAAHCKVLEPERFAGQFRIWEKRAKSDPAKLAPQHGKVWDEFKAQADADRFEILTIEEARSAEAIAAVVRSDPNAMRYLAAGEPEVTMQCELQGRACRGRVDWLTRLHTGPVLVGLKTSVDCRPFYFGKQAAKLGYHMQWAWYNNLYQTIKAERPRLVEIVVESKPPYAVAVYNVPDDVLIQGEEEALELLAKLQECEVAGRWPGPVPVEEDVSLPTWAYRNQDNVADLGLQGFES